MSVEKRHYRIWFRTLDGLEAKGEIMVVPVGFKKIIERWFYVMPKLTTRNINQMGEFTLLTRKRRYSYQKTERRKIWFQEIGSGDAEVVE